MGNFCLKKYKIGPLEAPQTQRHLERGQGRGEEVGGKKPG